MQASRASKLQATGYGEIRYSRLPQWSGPMTVQTFRASDWTQTAVEFATRAFRRDPFRWTRTRRRELHDAIDAWSHEGVRAPKLTAGPAHSEDSCDVPEYLNDVGASTIWIGALAFSCVGASPPNDHPHVYLNIKGARDIPCPYCSTHFSFRAGLGRCETDPPGCYRNMLGNSAKSQLPR